jgi:hypothetical protein
VISRPHVGLYLRATPLLYASDPLGKNRGKASPISAGRFNLVRGARVVYLADTHQTCAAESQAVGGASFAIAIDLDQSLDERRRAPHSPSATPARPVNWEVACLPSFCRARALTPSTMPRSNHDRPPLQHRSSTRGGASPRRAAADDRAALGAGFRRSRTIFRRSRVCRVPTPAARSSLAATEEIPMLERRLLLLLTIWCTVLSIAMLARLRHPRVAELDAERINIIEADGTRRLVLSNKRRAPLPIVEGKEGPRSIAPAGLVFYDESGSETGGIGTFRRKDTNGDVFAFDYARSEAIGLVKRQGADGKYEAWLVVNDPSDRASEGITRVAIGTENRASSIELDDSHGRPRIRLAVDAADRASIAILDEQGRVISRWPDR